jgi:hypothetical protein
MIISHVKIIAFQLSLFCKNYRFSKTVLYIINRIIHGCLEIPYLFLVLNMISHSFAALTREISCSTLEINMVFPRTHVLFSIYRGYYTTARRYDFYLRVVKTIFYERAQRVSKILFLARDDKSHIFKPPCNALFII